MGIILRRKLATYIECVNIAMCQFVHNFLSYVSDKYYLNWFTAGKVITKIKRVKFLLRHSEEPVSNSLLAGRPMP